MENKCRNPKCGTSLQFALIVREPFGKPKVKPALCKIQEQILQSIREAVRGETDHAVKNGLTK